MSDELVPRSPGEIEAKHRAEIAEYHAALREMGEDLAQAFSLIKAYQSYMQRLSAPDPSRYDAVKLQNKYHQIPAASTGVFRVMLNGMDITDPPEEVTHPEKFLRGETWVEGSAEEEQPPGIPASWGDDFIEPEDREEGDPIDAEVVEGDE